MSHTQRPARNVFNSSFTGGRRKAHPEKPQNS
jgi:hypothetical protein